MTLTLQSALHSEADLSLLVRAISAGRLVDGEFTREERDRLKVLAGALDTQRQEAKEVRDEPASDG